jgi:hypothetical protein
MGYQNPSLVREERHEKRPSHVAEPFQSRKLCSVVLQSRNALFNGGVR